MRSLARTLFILFVVGTAWAEEPDYSHELPRLPPVAPEKALQTFQVQPGYRLELVAAEPLISSPVAACWDEQGRLFVVEMRGYSEHRDGKLSRIRLLFDDNNDGQYDRATVFADQLLWPTAVHPWDGGIYIADAPDILYLKDTDGDCVADVRRRVFTGFGTQNVQGLLNTFLWGPDNRIHGTASSNGGEITVIDRPDVKPISVRGRDFSFDPRSLDFRAESGGAQHGMTFDDFGRKFVSSNSDHVQQVMFEDRYVARNPLFSAPGARVSIAADGPQAEVFRISPVEPWRVVRTRLRVSGAVPGIVEGGPAAGYFTGASGVTAVRGSAFRNDELAGMLVVGDVGSNLVHRKRLQVQGVQYTAERVDKQSELIASKDNWFRPAQFANGPDGGLYIIDVYREVIEHPASLPPAIKKHLDLDSGRDRGRIYRLVPEAWRRTKFESLAKVPTPEMVSLLDHDNAWHRETAARRLYERLDELATEPLKELLGSRTSSPVGRIAAALALAGLRAVDEPVLLTALGDQHPQVRIAALRMCEPLLADHKLLREKVMSLASDDDAQVRFQLAFTLGVLPDEFATTLTGLMQRHPADHWLNMACLCSLGDHAGQALLQFSDEESANQPRLAAVINSLAQVVTRQPQQAKQTAKELCRRGSPPHVLVPLERELRRNGGSLKSLLEPSDWRECLRSFESARLAALRVLDDQDRSTAEKSVAISQLTLAEYPAVEATLRALLAPQSRPELQLAAIRAIDEHTETQAALLLLEVYRQLTPAARRAAVDVLARRPERSKQLLEAVAAGQISAGEIDPAHGELFKKHAREDVRKLAAQVFAATANRADVVEKYRPVLKTKGEIVRGKELFGKQCAGCHRVENVGHEIGPNLAAMKNRGPEAILLNVLDPNREVNPQYLTYIVVTNDGRTLTGLIASESATSITLKRADGQGDQILRTDIDELRGIGLSLMPEGLERTLDEQALADVIAYLMSLP